MTDARFPRARRIAAESDFDRIYALKQRVGDDHLLIFAAPNPAGSTRIGLSVSRKHGNSVVRHRLKRLLREAYRLEQHDLPEGLDLVLIPRIGAASTVDDYRRSLRKLVPRLARRLGGGGNQRSDVNCQKSDGDTGVQREGEAPAEPHGSLMTERSGGSAGASQPPNPDSEGSLHLERQVPFQSGLQPPGGPP